MAPQLDFLARLDLDASADERQVRRAYARELKRIDQERDLEGFQHLRACYEKALEWIAGAGQHGTPEAAPSAAPRPASQAAPESEPMPPAPSPYALGGAVFTTFQATVAELATLPDRSAADEGPRIVCWAEALRAARADPRLMHLDAGIVFEHHVAALLAQGWRPGHQWLLPAAIDVFGWNGDRQALLRHGHPGRIVDVALGERAMFQAQILTMREQQRVVLTMLRQTPLPDERTMRRHVRALRTMAERFPHLLPMLAPRAAVVEWLERCPPVQPADGQAVVAAPAPPRPSPFPWAGVVVLLLLVLRWAMPDNSPARRQEPPPSPPRASSQTLYQRPAAMPLATGRGQDLISEAVPPTFGAMGVTEERMDEIRRRIDYHPGLGLFLGQQNINLLVTLGDDGLVDTIDVLQWPSDRLFAEAVKNAILATGPFPRQTSRMFSLTFSSASR